MLAGVGGFALFLVGLARPGADLTWQALALLGAAVLVGSVAAGFVGDRQLRRARVGVDLDASRRWVSLYGVHPAFVSACEQREQHRQRT
jgi:hypothetical protein